MIPSPQAPVSLQLRLRRREVIRRGVAAVTRVTTALALTATGAIVGQLGHQARVRDAALAGTAPSVAIAPEPRARPVRTVVVRQPASARPLVAVQRTTTRTVQPPARAPRARTGVPTRAPVAPRPTKAKAATTTSGS